MRDAAFGIDESEKLTFGLMENYNLLLNDNYTQRNAVFDNSDEFSNAAIPDAGRAITSYGLKVREVSQSDDKSVGKVLLYR